MTESKQDAQDATEDSRRVGHAADSLAETILPHDPSIETVPGSNPSHSGSTWVGKVLGKYRITATLGQGGMGMVLMGHDPLIERAVAIKVLADHLANDATALRRFLSEAQAVGKLNHPNVSTIYEIGQEGGKHYLVMEFLSGGSIAESLQKRGPLSVLEATQTMIGACKGMSAAHAAGLIHRDIKPANLMRSADGSTKVTDFGLAKITSEASQLTQMGTVLGTPFFMSPEQCEGKPLDVRSDLYSMGATYYSLLTGKHPYDDSDSLPQVMFRHCHGPIPDPRSVITGIPEACANIIARAMAKAPADRYQSANEMLADLEAVAATLSGQMRIVLPSESSRFAAIDPNVHPSTTAPSLPPAHVGRRHSVALLSVIGIVLLAAASLIVWQPWQRRTAPAGGAATGPVGEPVKVGILHSLSGTMATSESVVVDATLFAIHKINAGGGVLGRPVTAVVADGCSDEPTFTREAERLIVDEHVSTVFGCWTSASRKSVRPIFEQYDHLLIYPLQYEGLEGSPNIVYLGATPVQQILPAVDWAMNHLHKRRFFLVGSDYVFPRATHEILVDYLREAGGELVGTHYLPLGSSDVQEMVAAIGRVQPDMILNTINGDSNVPFFRALRGAGIRTDEIPCLSFSVGEQQLRSLDHSDVAGDYAAWTYFESIDSPANKDFVKEFHEQFPQRSITDPMEAAYVGVQMWAAAVNEAGSLDPRAIRRAMLHQRFDAPSGPVRIDPETQHCFKTPRIGQIRDDGRFEIVWSAAEPVAPDPYPPTRTTEAWRELLHDLYTRWGNQWSAPNANH